MVTALTVNYNTPDNLERLLVSFRKFYDIPYMVIDGSNSENYEKIKDFRKKFNINLYHFDHNIHHGPGMAWGIQQIATDQILFVDSDMIILKGGFIEDMEANLKLTSYGIGDIQQEFYITNKIWIPYLHPAFALVNREVILKYSMPIRNGAPFIEAMKAIHLQKVDILQRAEWLTNDLWNHARVYVQHNDNHAGMGTVVKTGGYNL